MNWGWGWSPSYGSAPPPAPKRHQSRASASAQRAAHSGAADEFVDVYEGTTVCLRLPSSFDGSTRDVFVPVAWGKYLRCLVHEQGPVTLPCGTVEAHECVSAFFSDDDRRARWATAVDQMHKNPKLLLDVLQYTVLLQSADVFGETCAIFRKKFCSLPLPERITTIEDVTRCGKLIRDAFRLPEDIDFLTRERVEDLVRFFHFNHLALLGSTHASLTHSIDVPVDKQTTNDVDFAVTLKSFPDPLKKAVWQPDDEVTVCPCGAQLIGSSYLSYMKGSNASHCRVCGKRKCVECVRYKVDKSIARLSKPGSEEPQMRKACEGCYHIAQRIQQSSFLGQVFVFAGLNILQLSMLRTVNSTWAATADLILHDFREALYEFSSTHLWRNANSSRTGDVVQAALARVLPPNESPELRQFDASSFASSSPAASTTTTAVPPPAANAGSFSDADFRATRNASLRDIALPTGSSAAQASLSKLYSSSASIFGGHPEHVVMLFQLLDWNQDAEVAQAIATLRETLDWILRVPSARQSYTHWELLCTRSCGCMNAAFFGLRLLRATLRAPRGHRDAVLVADLIVDRLFVQHRHDRPTQAAIVPMVVDLLEVSSLQLSALRILKSLASDEVIALQAICDLQSRESATMTFSNQSIFLEILYGAPGGEDAESERASSGSIVASAGPGAPSPPPPLPVDPLPPQQEPSGYDDAAAAAAAPAAVQSPTRAKEVVHRQFTFAKRFLDVLDSVMQGLRSKGTAADDRTVAIALANALRSSHLALPPTTPERHLSQLDAAGRALEIPDEMPLSTMMFPFDHSITIRAVRLTGIRVMNSKVRPVVIPLVDTKGRTHDILWKGEDLRQDYIVCLSGILLLNLLHGNSKLTIKRHFIPQYRVLPLSQSSGVIQCVPHSKSIKSIAETMPREADNKLLHFLRQQHAGAGASGGDDVAANFLHSAKFFILFNYLFKLRDRHRDNVMVTREGRIFHVDFGMILNEQTVAEAVTSSYVRFDEDMVQSIDHFMASTRAFARNPGTSEARVQAFLNDIALWFVEIRPHAQSFYMLLVHLSAMKHASVERTAQRSLSGYFRPVTSLAGQRWAEEDYAEDDAALREMLNDIFLRRLNDASARDALVKRIKGSQGKERFKDWSYEARKLVTGSWLSDIGNRMLNMIPSRPTPPLQ